MEISGRTKICGIIGYPVKHSLSPVMHNAAFKEMKLDFTYVAFEVKIEELKYALRGTRSLGIYGLNVTMPHKNKIMKYIDEIDNTAKLIGAVNTILNEDGKLVGFNTDGLGALKSLEEKNVKLEDKKILLVGAGGAARAIAFYLAKKVEKLTVLNRTEKKSRKLAKMLRESNKKVYGRTLSLGILKEELENSNILINATSVGMYPNVNQSLIDPSWLRSDLLVMEIVYSPLETKLVKDAKSKGAKIVNGLEMLVYQGAASFEIWTKKPAPIQIMREAALKKIRSEPLIDRKS